MKLNIFFFLFVFKKNDFDWKRLAVITPTKAMNLWTNFRTKQNLTNLRTKHKKCRKWTLTKIQSYLVGGEVPGSTELGQTPLQNRQSSKGSFSLGNALKNTFSKHDSKLKQTFHIFFCEHSFQLFIDTKKVLSTVKCAIFLFIFWKVWFNNQLQYIS